MTEFLIFLAIAVFLVAPVVLMNSSLAVGFLVRRAEAKRAREQAAAKPVAKATVRTADDADRHQIAEIVQEVPKHLRARPSASPAQDSTALRLVAVLDGLVVGVACLALEERRAHLLELIVREPWRRRGVARALVEDCLHRAGDAGVSGIWMHTWRETGCVATMERLGFQPLAERNETSAGKTTVTLYRAL